jgi:hypothetical protein
VSLLIPTPGEYKTVQARILAYAQAIRLRHGYGGQVGWTIVSRAESKEASIGQWQRLPSSTLGKRDFYFPTLCYSHS